ncbi:MAG: dipeptidyl aminopeptidase [Comamonadaceae bacterium]|nr:MAG: dipeptidyl aminopeptidase [Comamonadaceae bacterium]
MRIAGIFAPLLLALSSAAAHAQQPPPVLVQPEIVMLPLVIEGRTVQVSTHLYRPAGSGPHPVVIFSHGRSGNRIDRAKLQYPMPVGHGNYWLRKGVAVIAPVRPGYGDTGGADSEDQFFNWQGSHCLGDPDYNRSATNASRTIVAAYRWAREQPWIRHDRILLQGQSVGGMATVATAALNLPGVVGIVNFAGGSGGNTEGSPGKSCKPQNLEQAYLAWGRQAKGPSLWLYAENDLYWGPDAPKAWHRAFQSGGSDAEAVFTGPLEGRDGHFLLNHGGRMWSVPLDAFVKKVGLVGP